MIVAIDGPAGAGKSTVAQGLADALGIRYFDTGAMYRALALLACGREVDPRDGATLTELARQNPVELSESPDGPRVVMAGEDVTLPIRYPWVTSVVSEVAAHRGVRDVMVAAQRRALESGDWVVEGRDVGSNVWPEAEVKIFLTASDRERARRRRADLAQKGVAQAERDVLTDIQRRDRLDSGREADPLLVPDGAIVVDSSGMALDEVIALIAQIVRDKQGGEIG